MDTSPSGAARRRPGLLLAASTTLFVVLLAVQAQAQSGPEDPLTLCANPAGQLSLAQAGECPARSTAVPVATEAGLLAATADLGAADAVLATRLAGAEDRIDELASRVSELEDLVDALAGAAELSAEVEALQATLTGVTRDDDTLVFDGLNLQVVNGTGTTDGDPNGTGNLIIGYDTARPTGPSDKSGSHYLVVGDGHNYTTFGGVVTGLQNTASGEWASVSGGLLNVASGRAASVSGGVLNHASGLQAAVSGGRSNTASGDEASVSGGLLNVASGKAASILGGDGITLSSPNATAPQ